MAKSVPTAPTCEPLGSDRLLGIQAVADCLGVCPVTASKIMAETGKMIVLHRKNYVLESSFLRYLRGLEVGS